MSENQYKILTRNAEYFLKLIALDVSLLHNKKVDLLAKSAILSAIRSMPEPAKNVSIYDIFVSHFAD